MRNNYKWKVVMLIICILIGCLSGCGQVKKEKKIKSEKGSETISKTTLSDSKDKKAIIVVPGISGSILYEKNTRKAVWAFENVEDTVNSMKTINNDDPKKGLTLACDEDGKPYYDFAVAEPGDMTRWDYGVSKQGVGNADTLRPFVEGLKERYGEEYDVFVWQYEWRLSHESAAQMLKSYIKDHKYNKIILISHSMGGNVCSQFLADSEDNRKMVEMFIPVCSPFLGAPAAIYLIANPDDAPSYRGIKYAGNFPSVYELFPCRQYNESGQVSDGKTFAEVNGTSIDYDEFIEDFGQSNYVLKSDGSRKPMFENIRSSQDKTFVDGKHITAFVNTQYIQSTGVETIVGVHSEDKNFNNITKITSMDGDGTVPLYSGICGQNINSDNVHIVNGVSHGEVFCNNQTISIIDSLIDKCIKTQE